MFPCLAWDNLIYSIRILYRSNPLKGIRSKITVWYIVLQSGFGFNVLSLLSTHGYRVQRNSFGPVLLGVSDKYKIQQENFRQSLDKMIGWGRQLWMLCRKWAINVMKRQSIAPKTIANVIKKLLDGEMRAKCASFETKPEIRGSNEADKKEKSILWERNGKWIGDYGWEQFQYPIW